MVLAKWIGHAGLAVFAAQAAMADERADVDCGDTKLVIWTTQDYEEQHVVVWFHDSEGEQIHPNVIAPGKFVPMCSRGAFLLLDNTGAHFFAGLSWMMSAKGDVLGSYKLGEFIVKHAVTADDALVWVQSFEWDGSIPRTRLVAVSAEGVLVHDRLYEAATQVTLQHAGTSYPIDVLKPDRPY